MSYLSGIPRRRLLLATPRLLAQTPAPDAASVIDQLRFAQAMLCGDCDNDLEREGVNRRARRSMIGADKLATARAMLDAAPSLHGAAAARLHVGRALEVLEYWDEAEAISAIEAAIAALRPHRATRVWDRPRRWHQGGAPPLPEPRPAKGRKAFGNLELVSGAVCRMSIETRSCAREPVEERVRAFCPVPDVCGPAVSRTRDTPMAKWSGGATSLRFRSSGTIRAIGSAFASQYLGRAP